MISVASALRISAYQMRMHFVCGFATWHVDDRRKDRSNAKIAKSKRGPPQTTLRSGACSGPHRFCYSNSVPWLRNGTRRLLLLGLGFLWPSPVVAVVCGEMRLISIRVLLKRRTEVLESCGAGGNMSILSGSSMLVTVRVLLRRRTQVLESFGASGNMAIDCGSSPISGCPWGSHFWSSGLVVYVVMSSV